MDLIFIAFIWFFIVSGGFIFFTKKERKIFYLYAITILIVSLAPSYLYPVDGWSGLIIAYFFFAPTLLVSIIFFIIYEYRKQKETVLNQNSTQDIKLLSAKRRILITRFYLVYAILQFIALIPDIFIQDLYATIRIMAFAVIFSVMSLFVLKKVRIQSPNSHILFVLLTILFIFYFLFTFPILLNVF